MSVESKASILSSLSSAYVSFGVSNVVSEFYHGCNLYSILSFLVIVRLSYMYSKGC